MSDNVIKVDAERRLVFGWAPPGRLWLGAAIIIGAEEYFDTDNQHIPESVTLDAWADFMRNGRVNKAMHSGDQVGDVAFAFPAYDDIFKSLGLQIGDQSGIIVGVYVQDDDVLNKYHTGVYKGFSVGGAANWEDVE